MRIECSRSENYDKSTRCLHHRYIVVMDATSGGQCMYSISYVAIVMSVSANIMLLLYRDVMCQSK